MVIHIAVVDDEERIRQGLAKLIELTGSDFKVSGTFASAQELLDRLGTFPLDFLITDIKMPQMDGLQLIEQLRRRSPGTRLAILSGFNDFVFARQAIRYGVEDYLLKPVDQKELTELLNRIRDAVEQDKARQEVSARERIRLLLGMNALHLREPVAQEALLRLEETEELHDRYAVFLLRSETDLSRDGLMRFTPVWKRSCRLIEWEPGQTLIIAAVNPGEQERTVRELGDSLLQYLPQHHTVRLGVSCIQTGAGGLRAAYEEARAGLQYSWYERSIKAVTMAEGLKRSKTAADSPHIYKQIDKNLRPALELLDAERIRDILTQWLREVEAQRPGWQELTEACSVLFELLRSDQSEADHPAASAAGPASGGAGAQLFIPAAYPHWEAFSAALLARTEELLRLLKENRQENRAVETVKVFIQQHYKEELELSRLADAVYLTPSYLSKLFRTETGETITDYIISVRIERAKELLLKEPGLKTYEVGEQVGYADPAYFNKVFKKMAGCTPKEYRERAR
ncbi:response regulator [Paenibacillus pinistramenti]|uniref:response regulator n=1 Tax=Paenibacillus pinistramenti TaxID=1768003 RepID=UPI001396798C|nr:response regulator [Paenibacillus pinistramenti]